MSLPFSFSLGGKFITLDTVREGYISGSFTPVDVTKALKEHILSCDQDKNGPQIGAYLEVYNDILEQAERATEYIAQCKKDGVEPAVFAGIPIAVKDNILIDGKEVTAASQALKGYKATYDATVISKLKEQYAIFIGRTNMDEFAMGGSTENSAFLDTKNPIDTTRVPGGSSGGSAAALAMNGAVVALGTDTGGSVRQPASYTGTVGLKPTYGAVSRHGIIAMGSSLDQVGPMAHTVSDVEKLFNAIKGQDSFDSTTISDDTYRQRKLHDAKPVIGIPRHLLNGEGIDPEVIRIYNETVAKLEKLGYTCKDIELPHSSYALSAYYIVMPAEVSSNMARYDGVKYGQRVEGNDLLGEYISSRSSGFGKEVQRRIILGTYVLSSGYYDAYYAKALYARDILREDFEKAYTTVDVVLTPTAPTPAFKLGEKTSDPLEMYLADIFTVTANLTGMPALSVPAGFAQGVYSKDTLNGKGLPVGVQLTAPHGHENWLFSVGKDISINDTV